MPALGAFPAILDDADLHLAIDDDIELPPRRPLVEDGLPRGKLFEGEERAEQIELAERFVLAHVAEERDGAQALARADVDPLPEEGLHLRNHGEKFLKVLAVCGFGRKHSTRESSKQVRGVSE